MRINIFGTDVIFLFDPDGMKQIMRYSGKYPERESHGLVNYYRRNNPKYNTPGLIPT